MRVQKPKRDSLCLWNFGFCRAIMTIIFYVDKAQELYVEISNDVKPNFRWDVWSVGWGNGVPCIYALSKNASKFGFGAEPSTSALIVTIGMFFTN